MENLDVTEPLRKQREPISPEDSMAEAGRKAIFDNFIQMLEHEAGSRVGEDIEEIHKMRVATRRMRSLFNLLSAYYRPKSTRPHVKILKKVARTLGDVRDMDVQIEALGHYVASIPEEDQITFQSSFAYLIVQRSNAHQKLVDLLDSKKYRKFITGLQEFLTTLGDGARQIDMSVPTPYQARHVLPVIIHEHLAQVRAYDTLVKDADEATLHALRIDCKRLRYLVTAFKDVLGSSSETFIDELKRLQDHLGAMQDAVIGQAFFRSLRKKSKLEKSERTALKSYIEHLDEQYKSLNARFEEVWESFNRRTVQRRLSDALLVLR